MNAARAPVLGPNDVHVWWLRPHAMTSAEMQVFETLLCERERQRYQGFVFAADRRSYLGAKALARTMLAGYNGVNPPACEFTVGSHGRPELSRPRTSPPMRGPMTSASTSVT